MASLQLSTVNRVRRAAEAVRDLIEECRPRGPLAEVERKRVAHVSRTAKWLQRAIGNMIADDERLRSVLGEFAVEDTRPTDEQLDAMAESRMAARGQ